MDWPNSVTINEVGPREGFQFEKAFIPTEEKVRLVDALSRTGVQKIEVTSFVSPKWVPQMADAEQMARSITRVPGVKYAPFYLNEKGLERAAATCCFDLFGILIIPASAAFSEKNTNRTIEETLSGFSGWIRKYDELNIPVTWMSVNSAFGCNYQGDIPFETVLDRVASVERVLKEHGRSLQNLSLADTMGWANPRQVELLLGKVRERWPNLHIKLHLHDTRGLGLANALSALRMGVTEFDSSVGGLGGCPFSGNAAAAGNICTEDLVFMCCEMGIRTDIDLDRLVECARLAESIVGHSLPGKVMKSGTLNRFRK